MTRTVLIIGTDARTDAIAAACAESPQRPELFAFAEMRNPGLAGRCRELFTGALVDAGGAVQIAERLRPDLIIIGPEGPLEAGYVDALRSCGFAVFGPSRSLARVESSKSWTRRLVDRYGIPGNPEYRAFDTPGDLRGYMEELGAFVVKPDGLTGGKGVQVFGEHLHSIDEAVAYAETVIAGGQLVQVEERLEGEEFSLQTITDGSSVIHCPLVQDHKRAFEGDQGPNTGGMGSYSCPDFSLPFLEPEDVSAARSINERVIEALAQETGEPYTGVLYGGFMVTRAGVRLIEYNARFGDPEALNVLPLMDADFVEICAAAATGELARVECRFTPKATVCKYLVPSSYPEASPLESALTLPHDLATDAGAAWYWAACEEDAGVVRLTSSRSGAFVGIGDSLEEAESAAESAAEGLERMNEGLIRHRSDIGRGEVITRRVEHMRELRAPAAPASARL